MASALRRLFFVFFCLNQMRSRIDLVSGGSEHHATLIANG